jgi:cation diffusion facilitator CzcD-associated flavoprotein CzcO
MSTTNSAGAPPDTEASTAEHHRVVIVGAGFAGIGAAIELKRRGVDLVVLERSTDVGGTWRENTYPGCRCDVPASLYSLSAVPDTRWSASYPPQSEIQDYIRHCAETEGIMAHIRWGHVLEEARWVDAEAHDPSGCAP